MQTQTQGYGATRADWAALETWAGFGADLLPVVSNPGARISPVSKLAALGKVPSRYTPTGEAVGFPAWTSYAATPADIRKWANDDDLGICIQTRTVRALDIDIADEQEAAAVEAMIAQCLGYLPARRRANSAKRLFAFSLPGDIKKRRMTTAHGVIELLATGQQFVAVGTHPSGARYEWDDGTPEYFPALTRDQLENLWAVLDMAFAVGESVESDALPRLQGDSNLRGDPVADYLHDAGLVQSYDAEKLHLDCPFQDDHTEGTTNATAFSYMLAGTRGHDQARFVCQHAHCAHRTQGDFLDAVGYSKHLVEAHLPVMTDAQAEQAAAEVIGKAQEAAKQKAAGNPTRFRILDPDELVARKPLQYLIKGVLPRADLIVAYGESAAGKTFQVLDMVAAIATGTEWRGRKTQHGHVLYVCAEGAGGFSGRVKALMQSRMLESSDLWLDTIADAPNLLEKAESVDLAAAANLRAAERGYAYSLVVIDTFAQVMPGGNENSGEDVGKVLKHCKDIAKALGCPVLLVHHSGKDATRGARGWSGLRAAADAELEVSRDTQTGIRTMRVTKMKDGQDGAEFASRLVDVQLGIDEDGEPITSCVVEPVDSAQAEEAKENSELGDNGRMLVNTYNALLMESGAGAGDGIDRKTLIEAAANAKLKDDPDAATKYAYTLKNLRARLNRLIALNRFAEVNGAIHLLA